MAEKKEKEMKSFELLNDSLGFRVNYLAKLMRSELEHRLHSFGLSSTQWTVLVVLLQEDMLSQRDIAERVFLDNATTTRVLDVLEARDFISRNRTDDDRRVQLIALSDAGGKFAYEASEIGRVINDASLSYLTDDERKYVPVIVDRLTKRMEALASERNSE